MTTDTAALTGRSDELTLVLNELSAGAQLVTLTGLGGIGKTTLAEAIARELGAAGTAIATVPLAHETAGGVAGAVARALGLAHDSTDARYGIAASMRARGGLLVLDNAEHVREEVAGLVQLWLELAPNASILVTSREALGIPRERVVELGPLGTEASRQLLLRLAKSARAWSDPESARIEALADPLCGVPLAIVLAAGRLRSIGLDLVERKMSEPLALLRNATGVDRHATLERTIAWSWDLLEESERATLSALAVFEEPFAVADAAALLKVAEPLELLARLVERTMLRTMENERFGFVALIRAFVRQRAPVSQDTQHRHAQWSLERAAKAAPMWFLDEGLVDPSLSLSDLSKAIDFAIGDQAIAPALLAEALVGAAAVVHEAPVDAAPWLARFESAAPRLASIDGALAPRVLLARAVLEQRAGKSELAVTHASAAADDPRSAGDLRAIALALLTKCEIDGRGDGGIIKDLLGRARTEATSREARLAVLFTTGAWHVATGSANELLDVTREMYADGQPSGLVRLAFGVALSMTGAHHPGQNELRRLYTDALATNQTRIAGLAAMNLGASLVMEGKAAEAIAAHERADTLLGSVGQATAPKARGILGVILMAQGEDGNAETKLRSALADLALSGERWLTPALHAYLALLMRVNGRTEEATAEFAKARAASSALSGPLVDRIEASGLPDREAAAPAGEGVRAFDLALLSLVRSSLGKPRGNAGTAAGGTTTPASGKLEVQTRGEWVRTPSRDHVDLATRKPLQRVVVELAKGREQRPNRPVPHEQLIAAAWPHERLPDETGRARLRVAMSELRKLGLRDVIDSTRAGHWFTVDLAWDDS